MSEARNYLATAYADGLRHHLARESEGGLQRAYELGRRALDEGVGLLDFVAIHHAAMTGLTAGPGSSASGADRLTIARAFFAEALSPFEMTHRGFRDAVAALRRINDRLEEESKRIAHALHDEAGPLLVTIHLALWELGRRSDPATRAEIDRIRASLNQIEDQFRHLSHELRPTLLDDLGLVPALRFLAEGISSRNGLRVDVEDGLDGRLPAAVETALYRIVREGLGNVVRHARAAHAGVRVARSGAGVECSIHDDGRGFEPSAPGSTPGLGLVGIRERLDALGGTLRITSAPGRGTELHASIPLEA